MDSVSATGTGVIEYPTSDGNPMAETDLHRRLMIEIVEVLRGHFAARPDVYVSGNLLVLYEEGSPGVHLSPDCFVAFGVPAGERDSYKVWEEGKYPDIVFEITSKKTRREDEERKLTCYRDVWRVSEYVLFDPRQEYLKPSFQGFRRTVEDDFVPIPIVHGQMTSEVLGLRMEREGVRLVFRDPATGRVLLTPAEEAARQERLERELGDAKIAAMAGELEESVARERAARAEVEELRRRLAALTTPPPAN
jgi:Uma2 family endonuclease